MKRALIALALLFAPTVQAVDCDCLCGFSAGVDALYLKASHCPIPYASGFRGNNGTSEIKQFWLTPSDDWGVRVHASYDSSCCWFADFEYLWFESKSSATAHQGNLDGIQVQGQNFTNGAPTAVALPVIKEALQQSGDSIHTRLKERFQHVDVRLGTNLYCGPCGGLFVYGNVRWAEIDFRNFTQQVTTDTPVPSYEQNARYSAGGLGVGIGAHSPVYCGVGAHIRAGLTGMIGESKLTKQESQFEFGQHNFSNPNERTLVVPAFDFRLGIDRTWVCQCLAITGKIGYQVDYYPGSLIFATTDTSFTGLPEAGCQDFVLAGLYFGICIGY